MYRYVPIPIYTPIFNIFVIYVHTIYNILVYNIYIFMHYVMCNRKIMIVGYCCVMLYNILYYIIKCRGCKNADGIVYIIIWGTGFPGNTHGEKTK